MICPSERLLVQEPEVVAFVLLCLSECRYWLFLLLFRHYGVEVLSRLVQGDVDMGR